MISLTNRIKLSLMKAGWSSSRNVCAIGCAFINRELLPAEKLAERVATNSDFENFGSLLRELCGFFAFIQVMDDEVFFAVDHVRSIPLFYAIRHQDILVSDDPHWIREQVHDQSVDNISAAEFLLTRSVSGEDTLSPSVKQVQAGEAVALKITSEREVRKESYRFYEVDYAHHAEQQFEELTNNLDMCLLAAFKRLAEYAGGSTIVVPLGGGLDSRLVVLMLKRIGYLNIISFTYGRPGNQEARISKKLAETLHIPWHFIPYSNRDWNRWYASFEWSQYSKFANGLSSTPHLQDWPAVWELKRRRLIPDDSIFVPGHMPDPDIYRNPRLPADRLRTQAISGDELVSEICEAYCTLQNWSSRSPETHFDMSMKVKNILRLPSSLTFDQMLGYFDRWSWENAYAKFMVNSVRVYEFWGYRWWLPLCDFGFVSFLRTLPFPLRFKRSFLNAQIHTLETQITSKPPISDTSQHNFGPMLVTALNKLGLRNWARRIRARVEYRHHRFAWYGLIPEDDYKRGFHGQENINTYLANQTVKQIFPQWEIPESLDFLARKSR